MINFCYNKQEKELFFSFDLGAAHFAGFSSELYANAHNIASYQLAMTEYNWLQEDLTVFQTVFLYTFLVD